MGEREELIRKKQELEEAVRLREAEERLEAERDTRVKLASQSDLELLLVGSNKNYAKLKEEQAVFLKSIDKAVSTRLMQIDEKLDYMAGERERIVKELSAPIREVKKEYDGAMDYLHSKSKQTVERVKNSFEQLWVMKVAIIVTGALMLVSVISVCWLAMNISGQSRDVNNLRSEVYALQTELDYIYKHDGGK